MVRGKRSRFEAGGRVADAPFETGPGDIRNRSREPAAHAAALRFVGNRWAASGSRSTPAERRARQRSRRRSPAATRFVHHDVTPSAWQMCNAAPPSCFRHKSPTSKTKRRAGRSTARRAHPTGEGADSSPGTEPDVAAAHSARPVASGRKGRARVPNARPRGVNGACRVRIGSGARAPHVEVSRPLSWLIHPAMRACPRSEYLRAGPCVASGSRS